MNEIFTLRYQKQYNLRNWSDFCVPKIGSIKVAYVVNIKLFFLWTDFIYYDLIKLLK